MRSLMLVPSRLIVAACLVALAGCGAKADRTSTRLAQDTGPRATEAALPPASVLRDRVAARLPREASDVSAATLDGTAYVVGGYDGARPLNTIVAWRPGSPARIVAHLPHPVRYAAVAAVAGRLMIAGGTPGSGALSGVASFDPATKRVRTLGRLPTATSHAAGAALGGWFLVVGGRDRARSQLRSIGG